jgi:hypothetical protein
VTTVGVMPVSRSDCLAGAKQRNELFWTEKYILYPAVQNLEFYALIDVRFSNRPFGVKHFQTIHHCSVDVAHGLALLL